MITVLWACEVSSVNTCEPPPEWDELKPVGYVLSDEGLPHTLCTV